MLRWIAAQPTAMDAGDVEAILGVALRTLERMPMRIDGTDEFFDYLSAFGCRIEGTRVFFPKAVLDATLSRIAEYKQENARPMEDPSPNVEWSVSGQAIYTAQTADDRIRQCTREDLATLCRVTDAIPGMGRSHPGYIPKDVPLKTAELHAFGTIALSSREVTRVSMFSPEVIPYYLRILEAVCGSREAACEAARNLHPSKVWVNTPMMISRESIEAPMLLRELTGQPLEFFLMPVAGMATPVTYAGALALITAEVIATNVISLAVDNRVTGWLASPLFFDMKNAMAVDFGPETHLLKAGASHLRESLFGLATPPVVALSTAAKIPSAQSVFERATQVAYCYALGKRHFGGLGTLHTSDIMSIVQLMLDMEIVSVFKRSAAGFEVNQETLAEELIAETAPEGARFMETLHTAEHYRHESWFPELTDRRVPMTWVKDPSDMIDRARAKALKLEAEAQSQCPLDDAQQKAIRDVLDEADRVLA